MSRFFTKRDFEDEMHTQLDEMGMYALQLLCEKEGITTDTDNRRELVGILATHYADKNFGRTK